MIDGKPVLLDLFCGAGGTTRGYQQAGFYVIGVDSKPQPRYVGEEFYVGDAVECLQALLDTGSWQGESFRWAQLKRVMLTEIDVIHASPPCQSFSALRHVRKDLTYPMLIEPVRELLRALQRPYVIENVEGSPLEAATVLCGSMFGLGAHGYKDGKWRQLRRHRLFESNVFILRPDCNHQGEAVGVYGHGGAVSRYEYVDGKKIYFGRRGGYQGGEKERAQAMGIDWMNRYELAQSIPPRYTKYVGERLLLEAFSDASFASIRLST